MMDSSVFSNDEKTIFNLVRSMAGANTDVEALKWLFWDWYRLRRIEKRLTRLSLENIPNPVIWINELRGTSLRDPYRTRPVSTGEVLAEEDDPFNLS